MGFSDFFSGQSSDNYNQVQNIDDPQQNKASLTHEVIAGAAAYEAASAFESHLDRNGQPQSHEEAKKIFAGLAGAAVDRLVETKGMDWVDREKAKREAERQGEQALQQADFQYQ